jgi:ATP adenylyltransferase
MDQLFAPWRIEWVERDGTDEIEGCPFCVLAEREDAREANVLAETANAYVLLNSFPYNPGHAMVIPHDHTGTYRALDEAVVLDHARLKQRTIEAFEAGLEPDGVNAGLNLGDASGGSIDGHLHTHMVPRWAGDTNFMPVTADTKVVVEAVADTYESLHEAFRQQAGATVADSGAVRIEF